MQSIVALKSISNVVQDGVRAAAEAWHATQEAEQGIHRYGVLLSQLPPSVGNAVGEIQGLVLRMEAAHAAVQEAAAGPAAAAPRCRTPGELVLLLAASRNDEPPPPSAAAAAAVSIPAVEVKVADLGSAPAGDDCSIETRHCGIFRRAIQ